MFIFSLWGLTPEYSVDLGYQGSVSHWKSLWGLTPMCSQLTENSAFSLNVHQIRSDPNVFPAHHGEVCEDLSSVGSYRSPCFVYNFFRNVYFFFMGSDPGVFHSQNFYPGFRVPDPKWFLVFSQNFYPLFRVPVPKGIF